MKQALSIAALSAVFVFQAGHTGGHTAKVVDPNEVALAAALAGDHRTPSFVYRDF